MGNDINEPITVGLSSNNHEMLETFKQDPMGVYLTYLPLLAALD